MMKRFKKHIDCLFDNGNVEEQTEKTNLEVALSIIFAHDENAEVRVKIKGGIYFIQMTDMEDER